MTLSDKWKLAAGVIVFTSYIALIVTEWNYFIHTLNFFYLLIISAVASFILSIILYRTLNLKTYIQKVQAAIGLLILSYIILLPLISFLNRLSTDSKEVSCVMQKKIPDIYVALEERNTLSGEHQYVFYFTCNKIDGPVKFHTIDPYYLSIDTQEETTLFHHEGWLGVRYISGIEYE